jgi:hypothetical protein
MPLKPQGKQKAMSLQEPHDRDQRLDLFRGLELGLIFLDHIPRMSSTG